VGTGSHYRDLRRAPVVGAAVAAGVLLIAGRGRVRRIEVAGPSMIPTLAPGDRLIVVPPGRPIRAGDLVALRDPEVPARLLVKRVSSVSDAGVHVRGDNDGASRDSRDFGDVEPGALLGVAVYRYHPRHRAGSLAERHRPGRRRGAAAAKLAAASSAESSEVPSAPVSGAPSGLRST
jgi:nickel-type superoxide dismutase maturation protease